MTIMTVRTVMTRRSMMTMMTKMKCFLVIEERSYLVIKAKEVEKSNQGWLDGIEKIENRSSWLKNPFLVCNFVFISLSTFMLHTSYVSMSYIHPYLCIFKLIVWKLCLCNRVVSAIIKEDSWDCIPVEERIIYAGFKPNEIYRCDCYNVW